MVDSLRSIVYGLWAVDYGHHAEDDVGAAGRGPPPRRSNRYFGLKGCLAVFAPAITSVTVGLPASARAMDSFVAW